MPNKEFDSLFGEDLSELVSNIGIEEGADVIHIFNDSYLSSESAVD